jgi:hypothetical protein
MSGMAPGSMYFLLGSGTSVAGPDGFSVVRIEHDGVVLTRNIEIKEGDQLTGLRIVVAYGRAAVRGILTVENGPLPEGARIFVGLTKPGEMNFRSATVDARGHFLIEGLPAGTYHLVAVAAGGVIQPPRTVRQPLTVRDGEVADVTITIDLNAPVKP